MYRLLGPKNPRGLKGNWGQEPSDTRLWQRYRHVCVCVMGVGGDSRTVGSVIDSSNPETLSQARPGDDQGGMGQSRPESLASRLLGPSSTCTKCYV